MPKIILTDITNIPSSANTLNQNFAIIEDAFLQVLTRINPNSPNSMEADIDMNSRNIYNCKYLQAEDLRINGESFTDLMGDVHGAISGSEVIYNDTVVQANLAQAAADSIASIVVDMSNQVNAAATSASLASGYAVESQNSFLNSQEQAGAAAVSAGIAEAAAASVGDASGYAAAALLSANDAAASAAAALISEGNASTSEGNAAGSAFDANASAIAAAASAASIDLSGYIPTTAIGVSVQGYDSNLTTWAGKTAPTGTVVGTSDTQTLTNKTLTSPSASAPTLTGIVTINSSQITHQQQYTRSLVAGAMPASTQTSASYTHVEATGDAAANSNWIAHDRSTTGNGSNSFSVVQGDRSVVRVVGSINASTMIAANSLSISNTTGTITQVDGYRAFNQTINSGNITTYNGFNVTSPSYSSTGRITTIRGYAAANLGHADATTVAAFLAADQTAASSSTFGFKADMTSGTGKWGFYHGGTANNAFNGNVRIGSTVAPTETLDITGTFRVSGDATYNGSTAYYGTCIMAATNASLEMGAANVSNTPYIDFHSGAVLTDYDARIIASGGNGTAGNGQLSIYGNGLGLYTPVSMQNNHITNIKTATFNSQVALATTTGAVTVDWTAAQNYKQNEPTGIITYTFTAPAGPCHLQLFIDSDGTSTAYTHIFPGTVIWMGATWAQVADKKAVINFWYDGTNYYAMGVNQI